MTLPNATKAWARRAAGSASVWGSSSPTILPTKPWRAAGAGGAGQDAVSLLAARAPRASSRASTDMAEHLAQLLTPLREPRVRMSLERIEEIQARELEAKSGRTLLLEVAVRAALGFLEAHK